MRKTRPGMGRRNENAGRRCAEPRWNPRTEDQEGGPALMDYMTAPFPYYGGKRRWAKLVWDRLGNPDVYLEPCGGSLAVLLGRPHHPRTEVVCDTNGLVCNFWRAMRSDPGGVAREADYPTIHQDLTARQTWLVEWARENAVRLSQDPTHFDVRAAGWWAWGACSWIGSGWCLAERTKNAQGCPTGAAWESRRSGSSWRAK